MNIYADNAATTKTSRRAIEAMLPYLDRIYGNPSSLHTAGQRAAEALAEQARGGAATGAASVAGAGAARGETNDANGANDPRATMKTARALHNTAKDFHTAAHLWRDGALY